MLSCGELLLLVRTILIVDDDRLMSVVCLLIMKRLSRSLEVEWGCYGCTSESKWKSSCHGSNFFPLFSLRTSSSNLNRGQILNFSTCPWPEQINFQATIFHANRKSNRIWWMKWIAVKLCGASLVALNSRTARAFVEVVNGKLQSKKKTPVEGKKFNEKFHITE